MAANGEVADVAGKTILPGLIDLHTHLTYPLTEGDVHHAPSDADATLRAVEKLRYFFESGITGVRDVGSQGDVTFRLKEWVWTGLHRAGGGSWSGPPSSISCRGRMRRFSQERCRRRHDADSV